MSQIKQEAFAGGTGTYVLTFEKGLKIKPSDVAKSVAPFTLKATGASLVRKIVRKGGAWMAGSMTLANPPKDGKGDAADLLAKVASLVGSGEETLQVTGALTEGKKGDLTLTLSAVKVPSKK